MSLAALTIDNTPADLLRWISDPQHVKPGAKMPALDLSPEEFRAIADYLRSLR
jgi:cytochrome c oxidase subunit II